MADQPAKRIRKLVAFAAADNGPEAPIARAKAHEALASLNTELLDTLAGQRKRLLEDLRVEAHRLTRPTERATKTDTGELVTRAMLLLGHYERIDALIPVVLLARIEAGHQLTNEERQQLDGPKDSYLDLVQRDVRERRKAERERRRASRRKEGAIDGDSTP